MSSAQTAKAGDHLPEFVLDLTPTMVVAGAVASRDFMPVHHDPKYATSQGAPDIFLNILTTNGYISRFITDWAGPEAMVRKIAIRLGVPAIPGQPLRFNGEVSGRTSENQEDTLELQVRVANDMGDHATGTVVVTLPSHAA